MQYCNSETLIKLTQNKPLPWSSKCEAPLGVFGIWDICGKNYRDTGYLRKKLLGYRILRSSFRDTGYSQKIVTYQMFDEKRSWITKYMPFSVFLLMITYKWKIYKCKTNHLTRHRFIMGTMADTLISGIFVTRIYGIQDIWSKNYRDTGY